MRNVQSHARTHFPRGRSRTGSGVAGFARHPTSPSCPTITRQRGECFSRSNGPKTNYPPSWKLSRKYWKARPAALRVAPCSFPARRFMCVGLSNDFWLTWPTEWNPTRECAIKRIESVRMEQPDRSEEKMVLLRSMGGNVRLHTTNGARHLFFVSVSFKVHYIKLCYVQLERALWFLADSSAIVSTKCISVLTISVLTISVDFSRMVYSRIFQQYIFPESKINININVTFVFKHLLSDNYFDAKYNNIFGVVIKWNRHVH